MLWVLERKEMMVEEGLTAVMHVFFFDKDEDVDAEHG